MKMTREHKILLGVVSLGVLTLGVDQLIPSGNAGPQAAIVQPPPVVSPSAAEPAAAVNQNAASPPLLPTGPSIASLLTTVSHRCSIDSASPRDAFVTTSAWFDDVPQTSNAAIAGKTSIDHFLRQHTLNAVMNRQLAIVNGETYQVGQSIVDFLLVSVEDNAATFEHRGKLVKLTLNELVRSNRR